MKKLNNYIVEKLKLTNNSKSGKPNYTYQPKDWDELRAILKERLEKDKDADLNDIDVSEINSMYKKINGGIFEDLDPHNIKIDKWDVSNVKDMSYMFYRCENFNCNLNSWDVHNVKNMTSMFYKCENFEGEGLDKWNTKNVIDTSYMFNNCEKFNTNLSNWNVSNIKCMSWMFNGCKKFIGKGLENWKILNDAQIDWMFNACNSLKNIPSWYKN